MLVHILKRFSYSEDGRTSVWLVPGEEPVEIRDDLCAGLAGEGFIDGAPHGLPLLSEGRRNAIIERVIERGRAELLNASDETLLNMAAQLEADGAHETKVEPPLETGAPQKIDATADQDGDGHDDKTGEFVEGNAEAKKRPAKAEK